MKKLFKIAIVMVAVFGLALGTTQGQDKDKKGDKASKKKVKMTFAPKFVKGETFRYKFTSNTTIYQGKKKQPVPGKSSMVLAYRVIAVIGSKAVVTLRFEKYRGPQGQDMSGQINRFLKQLRFLVGPGLQVKRVYGLDKMVTRALTKNLPLNRQQKRMIQGFIKGLTDQVSKNLAKRSKGIGTIIERKKPIWEGKKFRMRTRIPMAGRANVYMKVLDIKGSGDKQTATLQVNTRARYGSLFRLFGYRGMSNKGTFTVDKRGITTEGKFTSAQHLSPLEFVRRLRRFGIKVKGVPGKMKIVSTTKMELIAGKAEKSGKDAKK